MSQQPNKSPRDFASLEEFYDYQARLGAREAVITRALDGAWSDVPAENDGWIRLRDESNASRYGEFMVGWEEDRFFALVKASGH